MYENKDNPFMRELTQFEKNWLSNFVGIRFLGSMSHEDDYEGFRKTCKHAIELDENDYDAWIGLGIGHVISSSEDGLSEALKCWERSQEIEPDDLRSLRLNVYFRTGHIKCFKDKFTHLNKLKEGNHDLEKLVDRWKQDLMQHHEEATREFGTWCLSNDPLVKLINRIRDIRLSVSSLRKRFNVAILIAVLTLIVTALSLIVAIVGTMPDENRKELWRLLLLK